MEEKISQNTVKGVPILYAAAFEFLSPEEREMAGGNLEFYLFGSQHVALVSRAEPLPSQSCPAWATTPFFLGGTMQTTPGNCSSARITSLLCWILLFYNP